MTNENEQKEPVGYRRPPVATRFKPGQSGNPSGRPKPVKTLKDEMLDELNERIRIQENGHEIEISKARAIAKTLLQAAVGGNMRALSVLVSFFARNSSDNTASHDQGAATEDTEILDDYIDRELRRRANGNVSTIETPAMHPHPENGDNNEQ